jgi:hypothetical protein
MCSFSLPDNFWIKEHLPFLAFPPAFGGAIATGVNLVLCLLSTVVDCTRNLAPPNAPFTLPSPVLAPA